MSSFEHAGRRGSIRSVAIIEHAEQAGGSSRDPPDDRAAVEAVLVPMIPPGPLWCLSADRFAPVWRADVLTTQLDRRAANSDEPPPRATHWADRRMALA